MPPTKKISIGLVQLGETLPVKLTSLCTILNKKQDIFRFTQIQSSPASDTPAPGIPSRCLSLDTVETASDIYFIGEEMLELMGTKLDAAKPAHLATQTPQYEFVIGITSVRITDRESRENPEDWFGIWDNGTSGSVSQSDSAYHSAILSVALWEQRYQDLSYRNTLQYLAYMIVAFLGDRVFTRPLTHKDYRGCVFDYNGDLESIVLSIKKASIHDTVKIQIADTTRTELTPLLKSRNINNADILKALDSILSFVRAPSYREIFRYLNDQAITSIFVIGVVISIALEPLINLAKSSAWATILVCLAFLLLMFKERVLPSGRLG